MARGKLYSYGCSFSTRQLVPREKSWVYLTAKHYDVKYEAWGVGGSEYHEAYHKLLFSMKQFKKGDLIIFQFTDHNRIGLNFENRYFTTASLPNNEGIKLSSKINYHNDVLNINRDFEDYTSLYEFANTWSIGQIFYHYWMVWNLLEYLKETVGIDFILLFLDQTWTNVIPPEHYKNIPYFPCKNPQETPTYKLKDPCRNVSLGYFCWDQRLAIGLDESYSHDPIWHPNDGHPGDDGNKEISRLIIKHINEKWDETNPWHKI
jgi:hypothetical protein